MAQILADTGPLVALIDARDAWHERCLAVARELKAPLLTTWPALTEATQLLARRGGWRAQQGLWSMTASGGLQVADTMEHGLDRMGELMAKYADVPMALADASLVALAEQHGLRRVFTLDSDFRIYRVRGRQAFEVVP